MIRTRPQRLFAPAPVGSMLKRMRAARGPRKPDTDPIVESAGGHW